MERLTHWNGKKWILPQGRTNDGGSYWRVVADTLAEYENIGTIKEIKAKLDELEKLKGGGK